MVKEGKDGKTGDRGVTVMFVGYSTNRTRDTYRFWKEATNCVIETRDAIWFNRVYFNSCLLYTSPSPRDLSTSRMPSSA